MKIKTLASTLMSLGLISPTVMAADIDQRIDKLEQEIKALKQEKGSATTSSSNVSIGGYFKMDGIVSDYSDGKSATAGIGEDFLVPSTIPTGGDGGDIKTNLHAKESRLWIKAQTNTDAGMIKGHLELDFQASAQGDERISNSYSPRVRHAYFTWDKWLFGQTWSTFFNVSALPELLDFVGPVSTIFIRQSQIRYSNGAFQFALENPSSTLYNGSENPYDDNQMPDLIGRYNFSAGALNMSVAAMVRELAYDDATGSESEMGYGVSFSGKMAIGDSGDDLRFMINQGNALGRYMGLNGFRAGVIEADGEIDLIDQLGAFVAYRHMWNDKWRSNFSLAMSEADNPDAAGTTVAESYQSVHANLIYKPTKALDLGAELLSATKELENGDDGSVNRLQFSAKYVY